MAAVLDRDLSSTWLDAALAVARQQPNPGAARAELLERLSTEPLGEAALKKTMTALTRIWLTPVAEAEPYAIWALEHSVAFRDWMPLHVGALLVREPFIRELLSACSMELRGNGMVDTVALRRRMRNVFGPKRSIDIATQRGVKTLRSLGILVGAPYSSISCSGTLLVEDVCVAAWLIRCLLMSRAAESIGLEDLSHAPELFALRLPNTFPRSAAGVTKHVEGVGRVVLALDG